VTLCLLLPRKQMQKMLRSSLAYLVGQRKTACHERICLSQIARRLGLLPTESHQSVNVRRHLSYGQSASRNQRVSQGGMKGPGQTINAASSTRFLRVLTVRSDLKHLRVRARWFRSFRGGHTLGEKPQSRGTHASSHAACSPAGAFASAVPH